MGQELMGATFSNPLGHVEDMPVVRLHDKIYQLNGVDWRYHDSEPLIKPVWLSNYLKSYIEGRQNDSTIIQGVKDPRAVHFLKDWQHAGGKNIKFVFIYRHWRTAAYSLLKRHSRHLINNAHDINKHIVNFSFWEYPSLPYNMWLSANRVICDFVKAHPHDCLLVSQEALVKGGRPPVSAISGINLTTEMFNLSTYQDNMLTEQTPLVCEKVLDSKLQVKLEECYQNLQSLSDLPFQKVSKTGGAFSFACETQKQGKSLFSDKRLDLSCLTWSELSGACIQIPPKRLTCKSYNEVLQRELGSVQDYDSLAKVAHMQGHWLVTRTLKMRANIKRCIDNMQSPFDLRNWLLFVDTQTDWLALSDTNLHKPNPFSLRSVQALPQRFNEMCDDEIVIHEQFLEKFCLGDLSAAPRNSLRLDANVHNLVSNESLSIFFSKKLLLEALPFDAYMHIAELTKDLGLFGIAEFAYFKALRLCFKHIVQSEEMSLTVEQKINLRDAYTALYKYYRLLPHEKLANLVKGAAKLFEIYVCESDNEAPANSHDMPGLSSLKHRFALLPHSLDYKQILSIGYENEDLGKMLDRLNSRLCMLCKDNRKWLDLGLKSLPGINVKASLRYCVHEHWRSLWPETVYNFLFNIRERKDYIDCSDYHKMVATASLPVSEQSKSLRIYVYDFEPYAFGALYTLLKEKKLQAQTYILLTKEQRFEYGEALDYFQNIGCKLIQMDGKGIKGAIYSDKSIDCAATWSCFLHCAHDSSDLSRQSLVVSWYTALGGEQSFNELYSDTDCPHMALPSYPPWVLDDIQNRPFYYPVAYMCWLNSAGLNVALSIRENTQHHFLIKLLHRLKQQENTISFVHQQFLKHFQ
ncbi:hypothetical protein [Agaribacter flavus]|uniref:Uncharacterized protein n=1 Tax=Agaribacter flavus TaxID=1902781 RepID=A0ABV7FNQ0_9ALTE